MAKSGELAIKLKKAILNSDPIVMKAYELNAIVTADGHIELPEFQLSPTLPHPTTVKVIILVSEADEAQNDSPDIEENFSEESFKRSWQQAINGDTVPVSQLWEDSDIV